MADDLPGKATGENWKNRIIETGEERPDQLLANPANWRIHPKAQQAALAGVLDDVGWVQQVIVNQRTGHLVDGHLRVQLALRHDEKTIPVVYVDLAPEEEALILSTLDPIAMMAAADKAKLDELLHDVTAGNEAVMDFLAQTARMEGLYDAPDINHEEMWQGMPEFEQEDEENHYHSIHVHFSSADDLMRFAVLVGQPVNKKTKYIWYPKQEKLNLKQFRVQDES